MGGVAMVGGGTAVQTSQPPKSPEHFR